MLHRLTSAALAVVLVPALAFAQEKKEGENPYRNAKVGDWVSYTMTTTVMGQKIESTLKIVVSAKDEKNATLKVTPRTGGAELPAQEMKIDLTQPYDPRTGTAGLPPGAEVKSEKVDEGKEKLKAGGKEYETSWTKMKMVAKVMGQEIKSDAKVWLAKDVPLGGLVKMESTSKVADMTVSTSMELQDSGNAKK
jgi:hypothetical protein